MTKLPDKPSELIRTALDDLIEAERGRNSSPIHHTLINLDKRLKLLALNEFAHGHINLGLDRMNIPKPSVLHNHLDIVAYKINPNLFKQQMRDLAQELEDAGL